MILLFKTFTGRSPPGCSGSVMLAELNVNSWRSLTGIWRSARKRLPTCTLLSPPSTLENSTLFRLPLVLLGVQPLLWIPSRTTAMIRAFPPSLLPAPLQTPKRRRILSTLIRRKPTISIVRVRNQSGLKIKNSLLRWRASTILCLSFDDLSPPRHLMLGSVI